MAHRKKLAAKKKAATKGEEKTAKAPPVEHGEVTEENPSGITAVSEERAKQLGGLRGFGGPGAAGATVAGPEVHVATEGGKKPLPTDNAPVAASEEKEEDNGNED